MYVIFLLTLIVYGQKKDNYGDKGAGYFKMSYNNLEFEIMGRHGNISLDRQIEDGIKLMPTKIQISKDVWVNSHVNPGLYVRGRYGKSTLKHVQSWRSVPGSHTSQMSYSAAGKAGWMDCQNPGHHSCLDLHDADGNVKLLPQTYPANK